MNLLFLLPRIPFPLTDGGAVATYNQLKYLKLSGHSITVLTLNPRKFAQDPQVIQDICDRVISIDVNTDPSPLQALRYAFAQPPYKFRRFYLVEFSRELAKILSTESFDLVLMDQTPMVLYAREIKALLNNSPKTANRTALVLRNHNVEYKILERMAATGKGGITSWYLGLTAEPTRAMEAEHYAYCDAIIPMTNADAQHIRALGFSGMMQPVPLGVNIQNFHPSDGVKTLNNSLAYFGSFDWLPNADAVHWLMAEIFPALRAKFPEVELHLGGRNPDAKILAYDKLAGVHVHPNVPSAADFLHSYDILLVPLRIGGGMRVKIIEAMAASKPIISTSIGAEGIQYTQGKDILIANTATEFIAAIEKVFNDESLKKTLKTEAHQTALQNYSWEALNKRLEAFLEQVLQKIQRQ